MHKKHPLSPSITPVERAPCEPVRHSFASTPRCQQEGVVLPLPPERDKVTANIRMINRQCFLMLCETHRGLLSELVAVPTKLVLAAGNIIKTGTTGAPTDLWTAALTHYAECLLEARNQVSAAAKLHGRTDGGREALEAIKIIEIAMPQFLQAAANPSPNQEDLRKSAERLGKSSMALTDSLSELLRAVESAIERARHLERSERP